MAGDRFDGDTVLRSAGGNHFDPADGQDVPEVPGGANQDGTIVIAVDPIFRFDDAVLVVGTPDTDRPRIPLTSVRFWDGTAWTEGVSDVSSDPVS